MSRKRKRSKDKPDAAPEVRRLRLPTEASLRSDYQRACQLAERGQPEQARQTLQLLVRAVQEKSLKALITNDLAALAVLAGDPVSARQGFQAALALDDRCTPARANLAFLEEEVAAGAFAEPPPADEIPGPAAATAVAAKPGIKVAILSFLFNWPSTGGGIVHTYELAVFLGRAGYDVRHFYVRYAPWEIGRVSGPLPFASEVLDFADAAWTAGAIQERFRRAVAAFAPDHVIVTDSWNFKPLLAEAVKDYPYILRLQALECLCPLNNVRLLVEPGGGARQCPLHQLANPRDCGACVARNGHFSGALHQAERALSGVGTPEYHERLLRAFHEAEAVLVVNPLTREMVSPYCRTVRVVTAGMDPARFPWPAEPPARRDGKVVLLFAGLVEEWMKGFRVLHEACAQLWQRRQDFELVATADPPGRVDAFTRYVGWQSQAELPQRLREADVLVMPTIAQEALGRTAVEAMAAGRPVVASALGGLPFTVADEATGLLCEPGDPQDLARKIERLLDDAELRVRLGQAGRRRFEEHYAWDVIIDKHYRPLLGQSAGTRRS